MWLTQKGSDTVMIEAMKKFLATNEAFRTYVDKNMNTYNRSLNDELASPITQEYYKSLLAGGCNHKEGDDNHDV